MKAIRFTILSILTIIIIVACGGNPYLTGAKIAINEKDWHRALRNLDTVAVNAPANPDLYAEVYYLKGVCFDKLNDLPQMSEYFEKSLKSSPVMQDKIADHRKGLVKRYVVRAFARADSADYNIEESLANLDTAMMIDPMNASLYRQAAVTAFNEKLKERAYDYAMKAIAHEGSGEKNVTMRELALMVSRENEDYKDMEKWAKDLMSIADPATDTTDVYLQGFDALIEVYDKEKRIDEAIDLTRKAMEVFPDNIQLKTNLAIIYIRKEDYASASKVYEEILEVTPDDFTTNLNYGTILVNQDRWAEAVPYLEKAYQKEPDNPIAVQNLMAAYFNSDQEEKGSKMAEKLKALKSAEQGDE